MNHTLVRTKKLTVDCLAKYAGISVYFQRQAGYLPSLKVLETRQRVAVYHVPCSWMLFLVAVRHLALNGGKSRGIREIPAYAWGFTRNYIKLHSPWGLSSLLSKVHKTFLCVIVILENLGVETELR